MTLRSAIDATFQRITWEVRIDDQLVPDVLDITIDLGIDQVNAQATVVCPSRPSWVDEGKRVEIRVAVNGFFALAFTGEVAEISWEYFAPNVGLDCRGSLYKARREAGTELVFTEALDGAVIEALLESCGITAHAIQDSGWTLGTIDDVVLGEGDALMSLISEIDELAGYATYAGPDDVVRRRRVSGSPGSAGVYTFKQDTNIIHASRRRSLDGIYNKAKVKGLTYEDATVEGEATADNPYIQGFITKKVQSKLVETDPKATEIAQRMVGDLNRRPEGLEMEVIGNPIVQPTHTITVEHDELETGDAQMFVEHVQHRIRPSWYTTILRTSGGNLSGYEASAPVAQLTLKLFLEHEQAEDNSVSGKIIAIADGSTSYDPDGPETGLVYAWSVTALGGTPTPATQEGGTTFRFLLPDTATSVAVTLSVTDLDGLDDSATARQTIKKKELPVEDLYTAEGTIVACSTDGQKTWREQIVPNGALATCLAPFAPAWGMVWLASDGHVYVTLDGLRTPLIDRGTPHGAVAGTATWVHETDTSRVWAAFTDGAVYFSPDRGVTWLHTGIIPSGPVTEIREAIDQFGMLRATAGNGYYLSTDGGASWTAQDSAIPNAWRMAAGYGLNLYSGLDTDTPLRAEAGTALTLPVLDPPVRHIRGLAFGWRMPELYAVDDQARLFRSDAVLTTLTQVATAPAGLNHLLRSGNEDGIVYGAAGDGIAANGGVIKTVRMELPFYVRRTGTRKTWMLAYGAAHGQVTNVLVEILIPTSGVLDPQRSGVWHHLPNLGWFLKGQGQLPVGIFWDYLAANPLDRNQWLLLGNTIKVPPFADDSYRLVGGAVKMADSLTDPLWLTLDAGETWQAVPISVDGSTTGKAHMRQVEWSSTEAGRWLMGVLVDDASITGVQEAVIVNGTGATVASPITTEEWTRPYYLMFDPNGDAVFSESTVGQGQTVGYVETGTATLVRDSAFYGRLIHRQIDSFGDGTIGGAGINRGDVTGDSSVYWWNGAHMTNVQRLTDPTTGKAANLGGKWLTGAADGVYVGGRPQAGQPVIRLTQLFDSSGIPKQEYLLCPLLAHERFSYIRAGRQARQHVACRIIGRNQTTPDTFVYDGAETARLAGPPGLTSNELADMVEVLEQAV